jgi:hypothetical protein
MIEDLLSTDRLGNNESKNNFPTIFPFMIASVSPVISSQLQIEDLSSENNKNHLYNDINGIVRKFLCGFLFASFVIGIAYLGFKIKKDCFFNQENRFNLKSLCVASKEVILENCKELLIGGILGGSCLSFKKIIVNLQDEIKLKNELIQRIQYQEESKTSTIETLKVDFERRELGWVDSMKILKNENDDLKKKNTDLKCECEVLQHDLRSESEAQVKKYDDTIKKLRKELRDEQERNEGKYINLQQGNQMLNLQLSSALNRIALLKLELDELKLELDELKLLPSKDDN